jgi:hypothetical protein
MNETGSKAAALGTSIHDWAESYCNKIPLTPPVGYEGVCYLLQEWIDENVDLKKSIAEGSMVSVSHGYAGRVDLQGVLKNGKRFIADFKTQALKDNGRNFVFYDKWIQQLTAYAEGDINIELVNIAISTNKDRPIVTDKWWSEEEKQVGWEVFGHCLKIWQLEKGYRPCQDR